MKMAYKHYVGNLWQALRVEAALKKEHNPLEIMKDDSVFYNWKLRLDPSMYLKSANMRMTYSRAIGII